LAIVSKDRRGGGYATGTIQYGDGGTATPTYDRRDSLYSKGHYNSLSIVKYDIQGSRILGSNMAWDGLNTFDYPSSFWGESWPTVPTPPLSSLATASLAQSNPNLSDFSLPNMVFELRELPGLVKQFGDVAISFIRKNVSAKTFASANLALQFGVSPMVQDAMKLSSLTNSVNNRLQTMQNLRKYGRINKKKRLGVYKRDGTYWKVFESNRTWIAGSISFASTAEIWGISEWMINPSQKSPLFTDNSSLIREFADAVNLGGSNANDRINAYRAATGTLRYSISDLWNIIPWSWAVDYFANIGQLADANDNSLGLIPVNLAVCNLQTFTMSHPRIAGSGASYLTAGNSLVTNKTRTPVSITSAQKNFRVFERFLTPNQVGILTSLAIVKNKSSRNPNPYMGWANSALSRL